MKITNLNHQTRYFTYLIVLGEGEVLKKIIGEMNKKILSKTFGSRTSILLLSWEKLVTSITSLEAERPMYDLLLKRTHSKVKHVNVYAIMLSVNLFPLGCLLPYFSEKEVEKYTNSKRRFHP